jgi:hypothetical protein
MAILDTMARFSNAQSIAAGVGDVVSTDIYDTGAQADAGIGEETYLEIRTVAAVTSGGGATVQFVLQTDDNPSFSSPREFPLTAALALSALTANTRQVLTRLPVGLERYLRVIYRIGTATTTGGTASAYLLKNPQVAPTLPTTVPGVK